jgi:AraC-like DNA-binding protein
LSAAVRDEYPSLFEQPPVERLLGLMCVLTDLTHDRSGRPLASDVFRSSQQTHSREPVDRVLAHIHEHYTQELSLQELANVAALSVPALHRMFRKHAHNVSEYITRIRIGDACARLASTEQPIAHISDAVGDSAAWRPAALLQTPRSVRGAGSALTHATRDGCGRNRHPPRSAWR